MRRRICGITKRWTEAGNGVRYVFAAMLLRTILSPLDQMQSALRLGQLVRYPIMTDPTKKPFRLSADQIRPLATGHGGCIATDMITCGGHNVSFMYREAPDRDLDSGWRFMSGLESNEYMDDPDNHAVYDVNTIANYDPDIILYLDAPVGSVFEREGGTGPFAEVYDFEPPAD